MRRMLLTEEKATTRRYFEEEELLTEENVINGSYIDANGLVALYTGWSCTDFIEVSPDDNIVIDYSASSAKYNAYYDKDYNFIKILTVPSASSIACFCLAIPENAKYIRMS